MDMMLFGVDNVNEFGDDVGGLRREDGRESVLIKFLFDFHEFVFIGDGH